MCKHGRNRPASLRLLHCWPGLNCCSRPGGRWWWSISTDVLYPISTDVIYPLLPRMIIFILRRICRMDCSYATTGLMQDTERTPGFDLRVFFLYQLCNNRKLWPNGGLCGIEVCNAVAVCTLHPIREGGKGHTWSVQRYATAHSGWISTVFSSWLRSWDSPLLNKVRRGLVAM